MMKCHRCGGPCVASVLGLGPVCAECLGSLELERQLELPPLGSVTVRHRFRGDKPLSHDPDSDPMAEPFPEEYA